MDENKFLELLKEAKYDVSIVGSVNDFVCFAVVYADSVGRVRFSDWLRSGKSNYVR